MITVSEALATIAREVAPGETEEVPLEDAVGRVLAQAVRSDVDWPPFDTTAMDGYAVRVADAVPGAWIPEREGLVAAGADLPRAISAGEAVRVMTGAPLPGGTEAIVPVERSARSGGNVRFESAPRLGAHIRRRAESVAAGALLASPGQRLRPADVALAALAGADPIRVFRAPRITVAVTGDEVVRGGQKPRAGRLRDSNGPMLLAECRALGRTPRRAPPVADSPDAVARLFAAAGETEDFLITTGGVSAGDLDLLPGAAAAAGFTILFHGVAMRPGKPVAFARRGRVFWLGLPGNPVSASVGFHVLGREALDRFEGDALPGPPRMRARLTLPLPPTGDRERFHDAVWSAGSGQAEAEPLSSSGSHDLAAHARGNSLIDVPAGSPELPAGSEVSCLLLAPAPFLRGRAAPV
jgi:molybdopterin molybdotransferase